MSRLQSVDTLMYQAASYNHPKQWIELVELLYLNKQIDCNSSNRKYSIEGEKSVRCRPAGTQFLCRCKVTTNKGMGS